MSIPKCITYSQVKPQGFATKFTRWEVYPQTSYQTYTNNEIIRIMFETQQFIDPYQSYVEVEVTFDPADYPDLANTALRDRTPAFRLDGPATSLFQQLTIYSNSKEVEKIQEYDQLGYILSDLGMDWWIRAFKAFEGYHYQRAPSNSGSQIMQNRAATSLSHVTYANMTNMLVTTTAPSQSQLVGIDGNSVSSLFAGGEKLPGPFNGVIPAISTPYGVGISSAVTELNFRQSYSSVENQIWNQTNAIAPYNSSVDAGSTYIANPKYNSAFINTTLDASQGVQHAEGKTAGLYGICNPLNRPNWIDNSATWDTDLSVMYPCNAGFYRSHSAGSVYNTDVSITPFWPSMGIRNGKFVRDIPQGYIPKDMTNNTFVNSSVCKKTFYIPILSGVMGTLIPKDAWKLIPGQGLGQMMFEWQLNPYAFYATGHNYSRGQAGFSASTDVSKYQHNIRWKVTKISMHFDLWDFGTAIQQQVAQQLQGNGISLTSQSFVQGPMYQISQTSDVNNTFHINNGIKSLRGLYFWFLDNSYQKYNYVRKQFRLSHNLASMQLKVGQSWIPQTPIQGNAGQLAKNMYFKDDYTAFYVELQRCLGTMFSVNKCLNITPEQYVLNERPYDPTDYDSTHSQQAGWHEARCRGQALYGFDLMADPFDDTVLTGMDTTQVRPIELVLKTNNDNIYNGNQTNPSTMYVLLHYDMVVVYTANGVTTLGLG